MTDVSNFLTLRTFSERDEANALAELLQNENIDYILLDNSKDFDPSFALNKINPSIELKIAASDFEKVTHLLNFVAQESIDKVPDDYYLHDFSSVELVAILKEPDLWGEYDYVAAQLVLRQRGESVNEQQLQHWRQVRIEALKQAQKAPNSLILIGYLGALLGGFLGLIVGYQMAHQMKVLPNGERVAYYDAKSQKQGKILLIFSSLMLCIITIFLLYLNSHTGLSPINLP